MAECLKTDQDSATEYFAKKMETVFFQKIIDEKSQVKDCHFILKFTWDVLTWQELVRQVSICILINVEITTIAQWIERCSSNQEINKKLVRSHGGSSHEKD